MKNIIIAIVIIMVPLFGTILSRSTFEEWEGTPQQSGWTISTGNDGDVLRGNEDLENPTYQKQSHGEYSLRVYDPNNNSYANAYKTFTNSASEYMIEFYLWIYHSHATIDSFPLCVLKNMPGEGLPVQTDIALVLDSCGINGHRFAIYLEDSVAMHDTVAFIDSVDRWYKIQIYRHPVPINPPVVDLYLDGDSVGTYYPMNSDKVSNTIVLGTTSADSLADGEVFYDDVIISTVPVGEHPRLLFTESDLSSLRARRNDTYVGGLGVSYATLWDSLQNNANGYYNSSIIHFPWPIDSIHQKDTVSYYPHSQLPLHPADTILDYWLNPLGQISKRLRILSLVGLIDNNSTYTNHCIGILNSLANWSTYVDKTNSGRGSSYAHHCTGSIAYGMALAYDCLFDSLSDYEKMNIQNTLIALGINQCYLQALYYEESDEPPLTYANGRAVMFGAGMGMACLSIDDTVSLHDELDAARAKIDTILAHSDAGGQEGGFNEGISYCAYANRHFIPFLIAGGTIDNYMSTASYLANYPKWEIYSMLSGAEQYQITGNSGFGPNWDISFCDYDKWAGLWNPATCYIANYKNDACFQWFAAKRRDMRWSEIGYFLWADTHLDSTPPASMPSEYPLSTLFSTIGWVTARTGWDTNDYIFVLKSGQREPVSHKHREQNSFILGGKGRWLIADLGYARRSEIRERLFHNVLDDFEDNGTALWRKDSLVYRYYTTIDTFTYCKSIDTSYHAFESWVRQAVFFNKSGSFVISDYAERITNVDSLHWRMHSWTAPVISENDRKIEINHPDGPNLLCYIVFPESINTDYETLSDYFIENGATHYFQRIKVKIDTTANPVRVIAGFIPYDVGESATLTSIEGIGLRGARLENDNGCAAVLFGMNDSTKGGKYEVSVTDSLLNIVCNLIPDTNYVVITKKGAEAETVDTLQTNDVGILSFKLNGGGNWRVVITLARTTGLIEINQNNTYCNMPFVALNFEMTNPLDSSSIDSMKLWQYYGDSLQSIDSTGWIAYDSTYFWHMKQGENVNRIYAQFMADGWNESAEYCDTIVFDETTPTGSFVINNDDRFTNNSTVALKNSFTDTKSGLSKMRYGNKYLESIVKNSAFDTTAYWQTDTAIYHDSLNLYEIPVQTNGNYFYQSVLPESLSEFDNDTLLLWIDLVSDGFIGNARVEFQYIYSPDTAVRGVQPYGASITIPEGTKARVSHYNLFSYFKYHPDPPPTKQFVKARIGVFVDSSSTNYGQLIIDNFKVDVTGPEYDYSRFGTYDTLRPGWVLYSGNGPRTVYGQFSDQAGNEASILYDTIIADTTKPIRKIVSPQHGRTVSDTVTIAGWAYDQSDPEQHFKQYELHYRGMVGGWYGIDPDSLSFTPEYVSMPPPTLGRWNTYSVSDGWYDLRLTVRDSATNYHDTTISVRVSNSRGGERSISGFAHEVYGIAASNDLYISEFSSGKVYRYSPQYQFIDSFTVSDTLGIGSPLAMAFDITGNIWLTNVASQRINEFSIQGTLMSQFSGDFLLPSGLAFDSAGNLWISDRMHHQIKKFDQSGTLLYSFGEHGSEPGELNRPLGVAFHDNRVYVADSRNKRIAVFDTTGSLLHILGDSAGLTLPFALAVDTAGYVYVTDALGDQVIEFDPFGNRLYTADSIFDTPSGIALSSTMEELYVADTRHKRVLILEVIGEPEPPGGPQSTGDLYLDRVMFEVFPTLTSGVLRVRLHGLIGIEVSLKVYDVTGRLVRTLYDHVNLTSNQVLAWDCTDDQDRRVSNGIYFVRLESDATRATRKTILLR